MGKTTIWKLLVLAIVPVIFSSCDDDSGGLTDGERFEYETSKIDAYVQSNGLNVTIDEPSGIRYQVISTGSGISPYVVDSVTISYVMRNLDTGEELLSKSNTKVPWNTLLIGVRAGLGFVQEGGALRFFLPSYYAYGTTGSGDVPPNATLIFDMELHEVHAQQLRGDLQIIEQYLDDNEISATLHPKGFYYSIGQPGDGNAPSVFSNVSVNYQGRLLSNGSVFDSGNNATFVLGNLIAGWQVGLPLVREGGDITLYLPSPLAYGTSGSPPLIPQNAPLIFDIDLINVL